MIHKLRNIRNLFLTVIDWFYFPFLRFIPKETFRYGITGGINLVIDLFLYFLVYTYILKVRIIDFGFIAISPHIAAFLIVFPITFSTGFIMAKYITFTASILRGRIQLFRYICSVAGSILLNYILLKLFVEWLNIYPVAAKLLTTLVVIIYSYLVQRYFTFKTGSLKRIEM